MPKCERPPARPDRLLVVGASSTEICGVRDHASVMAQAFTDCGVAVETVWWERDDTPSVRRAVRGARTWLRDVERAACSHRPDWVLWHYSVFTYGWRGLPYLAPLIARRLTSLPAPTAVVLHEMAYPFGRRGLKGAVLAVSQRAALVPVVAACGALVTTTEGRLRWLASRVWLPPRPSAFVPVPSNLPAAARLGSPGGKGTSLGVMGFGAEGLRREWVLGAVAALRSRGIDAQLTLLGAPGPTSDEAERWRVVADAAGCPEALRFSGVLPPEELAGALSAVDILLLPDESGPTSRKTALAAALALGRPVVALDGPRRWEALAREGAVLLASHDHREVGALLETLGGDPDVRRAQGARGCAFYGRWMHPIVGAERTIDFLRLARPQSLRTRTA